MKIRCATNSVRLRVRKSDIVVLKKSGVLSDKVAFPAGDFVFTLKISAGNTPEVSFLEGNLKVEIPSLDAAKWMGSDQVGLSYMIESSSANIIEVLIEKDFPCKEEEEDHSDTFFELDTPDNAC